MFLLIRPQIDANNKKYANSKKWWAPQGNSNAKKDWGNDTKQPKTTKKQPKWEKKQPKEKDKVKVNVKEKVKDKEIADAIENSWLEEKVINLYIDFLNQRTSNRIPNTIQATTQHLNLLNKQENKEIRLKILENSINNSYRWLFELNEKDIAKLKNSAKKPEKIPREPPKQNALDPLLS